MDYTTVLKRSCRSVFVRFHCAATWIMMDIKIYVCNGIYHDLIIKILLISLNEFMQKMVRKKEEIRTIINKMPSTAIQTMRSKIHKLYNNEATNWD
jgi:hypothetical protein